jgi:CSLREA domain-containing protein
MNFYNSNKVEIRKGLKCLFPILSFILISFSQVWGAVFTVNSNDDSNDGVCNSSHCSLREAINNSNANSGKDTIKFNIEGIGPHTIQPNSALPTITGPVIIDGYTQAGSSPNTNPIDLGSNAMLMIEIDGSKSNSCFGLAIFGGDSLVKGLVINQFTGMDGCGYFSGSGIYIRIRGNNVIEGNFIGTDYTGTEDEGNRLGISIRADNNVVGGTTASTRNIISGNNVDGMHVYAKGNKIQGNFIGTDHTGTIAIRNSRCGVALYYEADHNIVGGKTPSARNIISGNGSGGDYEGGTSGTFDGGIILIGGVTGNSIEGNFIGTDISGTKTLGNITQGIYVGGDYTIIGGSAQGSGNLIAHNSYYGIRLLKFGNQLKGNVIAYNGGHGVFVDGVEATNNSILFNNIFSNGQIGIDLGPRRGVTANDLDDYDVGPNYIQNFPLLSKAISDGDIQIKGTLNSTPNTDLLIEFFANTECDLSGYGEGEKLIGSTEVTTGGDGNANFTVTFEDNFPSYKYITSTATDPNDNTSEFSECIAKVFVDNGLVETKIQAESFDAKRGVNTGAGAGGVKYVGWIENNDHIMFEDADFGSKTYGLKARVASKTKEGTIKLRLGSVIGTRIGSCSVPITNGWENWKTVTCNINAVSGITKKLYLVFHGSGWGLFNLDWISYLSSPSDDGPTGTDRIEAESFDAQRGTNTGVSSNGIDTYVGWIENNDYIMFKDVNLGTNANQFIARAASKKDGGYLKIRLGSKTGEQIGSCRINSTSGWESWAAVSCDIKPVSGKKDIYLVFSGSGYGLFNIDWFLFASE